MGVFLRRGSPQRGVGTAGRWSWPTPAGKLAAASCRVVNASQRRTLACEMDSAHLQTHLSPLTCLVDCGSAGPVSFPSHQYTKVLPTSGPSHTLFPLPGSLSTPPTPACQQRVPSHCPSVCLMRCLRDTLLPTTPPSLHSCIYNLFVLCHLSDPSVPGSLTTRLTLSLAGQLAASRTTGWHMHESPWPLPSLFHFLLSLWGGG